MKCKRQRKTVGVPTASMGDIAMLLIIFFILCSNFSQKVAVELQAPRAPDLDKVKDRQLSVAISKYGDIFLRNKKLNDAEAVEWALASLLKDAKGPEERVVMFACDKGISRDVFEPVLEAIAKAGGTIAAVGESSSPAKALLAPDAQADK